MAFNQPVSGNDLPRFAGPQTFMRLPDAPSAEGLDVGFIGVPMDTGTPEIGGLTTPQAMQLIRNLRGLNVVGCDLVEVSPPYDPSGNTALVGANIMFEMLSILPGVTYR